MMNARWQITACVEPPGSETGGGIAGGSDGHERGPPVRAGGPMFPEPSLDRIDQFANQRATEYDLA